jgi:beta-phosphoglucomutase
MNNTPFAVIFDMDGVIIDSNPYHLISWRDYLLTFGIEASDEALKEHMFGKSNSYILSHFFQKEFSYEEKTQMQYDKEKWFRTIFEAEMKAVVGFEDFLADLLKNGVKTGIGTSAPVENLALTLAKIPITQQIHSKMSESDVKNHKPHPEVYLTTAERLGILPEHCIVFEDSVSGVQAGLNAGMKVVGVLTTYTPVELPVCNAYIKDFKEIDFDFCQKLINS